MYCTLEILAVHIMLGGNQQTAFSDQCTWHYVPGSLVVEQLAKYQEVACTIHAQFQLFINFQISWASENQQLKLSYHVWGGMFM